MLLAPSFGFCAPVHHARPWEECFSNYGQTPPAVDRKLFAPAVSIDFFDKLLYLISGCLPGKAR